MDDNLIMIPLITKETSDERHFRIMKWLIVALIVSNLAWMTSCGIYHVCHCMSDIQIGTAQETAEDVAEEAKEYKE